MKYQANCEVCGHKQAVDTYGDWTCENCGQGYRYDEGHTIVLTPAQLELLRAAKTEKKPS